MQRFPALFLVFLPLAVQATELHQRLGAYLFGEPVGEVELRLSREGETRTLSYDSTLLVVRDSVRLRQSARIEVSYSDRLLGSTARRCSGPEGERPQCSSPVKRTGQKRLPSLAAELILASRSPGEHCLEVVDEESGAVGEACAEVMAEPAGGRFLEGRKFNAPFRARIDRRGMLVYLELPDHGARFEAIHHPLRLSGVDLFSDPVPSSGDVHPGLQRGLLRLRLRAPDEALNRLGKLPGQRILERSEGRMLLELRRKPGPTDERSRAILDASRRLIAENRSRHTDCQTATQWFVAEAAKRGWKAREAVGIAWVDGRFAFHAWALLDTPAGTYAVDPLLAQAPADAGHLQLGGAEDAVGTLLVAYKRGLSIEVIEP